MTTRARPHLPRITAAMRETDQVTPLELFFDLVFVLALTQCTQLMSDDPTWSGLAEGLLILALVWWSWVGYSWLTSVIDPEEDAVRVAMFVAMAGLLLVALCVPDAFGDLGLAFALAYGVVRAAHVWLFMIASRDEPGLRRSIVGFTVSTAIGVALLVAGSTLDGAAQGIVWALALALDMAGPYVSGSEGWKIIPGHFAERHGLIFLIALGESIVAIGVGSEAGVDGGVITAAVLGVALAAAMWWAYFDVVAIVAARRLAEKPVGREQNEMARDSYSLLHFPMVAGVVLIALGIKTTIAHVDDTLSPETAFAMVGGLAIYLLAHIAFRLRNVGSINKQRLVLAVALVAFIPFADQPKAGATLAAITVAMVALIAYEARHFAEAREQIRHQAPAE